MTAPTPMMMPRAERAARSLFPQRLRKACWRPVKKRCQRWSWGGASAGAAGVLDDLPVVHPDRPVGHRGDRGLVGHEDDGKALGVEGAEEGHDLGTALRVEVAGRLVGEDEGGAADEGAGDGDPLLLAAGELVRLVVPPVADADVVEEDDGIGGEALAAPALRVDEGEGDVLLGGDPLQEVELLEDEADGLRAEAGERVVGEVLRVVPRDAEDAGAGPVEEAEDLEEGRFPRARGPDDRDELALPDPQGDALQGGDDGLPHEVGLADVFEDDHGAGGAGRRGRAA